MKHAKIDFSQFTNDQLDVIYEKTVGYKPIAEDGQTREQAIELIASYNDEHGVTIPSQIENSPQGQKAISQQSQHTPGPWKVEKNYSKTGAIKSWSVKISEYCTITLSNTGPKSKQVANLISLAPEMLEALKDADLIERTLTMLVNGANVSGQSLESCRKWFADNKFLLSRTRQ